MASPEEQAKKLISEQEPEQNTNLKYLKDVAVATVKLAIKTGESTAAVIAKKVMQPYVAAKNAINAKEQYASNRDDGHSIPSSAAGAGTGLAAVAGMGMVGKALYKGAKEAAKTGKFGQAVGLAATAVEAALESETARNLANKIVTEGMDAIESLNIEIPNTSMLGDHEQDLFLGDTISVTKQESNEKPKAIPIKQQSQAINLEANTTAKQSPNFDLNNSKKKIQEVAKLNKDLTEKIDNLAQELKLTNELTKKQLIKEKIEREQKNFEQKARSIFGITQCAALGLATFASDAQPDDIRNASRFSSAVEHAYSIFQNSSAIHTNNILVENGITGVDITPNIISMITSVVFLVFETIAADDDAPNGFECILDALKERFGALSKQIAKLETKMLKKFEEATDDRYHKHLIVLKEFAQAGRERLDLKVTVEKLKTALLEKNDKIIEKVQHIDSSLFNLQQLINSNLEALRTEKVDVLIKKIELSKERGDISTPDRLHYFLDRLHLKGITGAKSKFVTGASVDVTNANQMINALKGVASLQSLNTNINTHPAFSNLNLILNFFKIHEKNSSANIKLTEEILANPIIWAICAEQFIKLLNDFIQTNSGYPETKQHKENILKMLHELEKEGFLILQFSEDIVKQNLIKILFDNYVKELNSLKSEVENQIKIYNERFTKERQFSLLQKSERKNSEFQLMPMPKFEWVNYLFKFIKTNFDNSSSGRIVNKVYGTAPVSKRGHQGKYRAGVLETCNITWEYKKNITEFDEFVALLYYAYGNTKSITPPGINKKELYEKQLEGNKQLFQASKEKVEKIVIDLFGKIDAPEKMIPRLIFPSNRKMFNLILPEPKEGFLFAQIYRNAEILGLGEINLKSSLIGGYIIVDVFFVDSKNEHLIYSFKKNIELAEYDKKLDCEQISIEEKLWDRWFGGRYPRPKDVLELNALNNAKLGDLYYPPKQPYPAEQDTFISSSEKTISPESKKIQTELKIKVESVLQNERINLNKGLKIEKQLENLDSAYYLLIETLKFVCGVQILKTPLFNNQIYEKNGDEIRKFMEMYKGSVDFLQSRLLCYTSLEMPEIWKSIELLKPDFPLVSNTIKKIKECIQVYEKRPLQSTQGKQDNTKIHLKKTEAEMKDKNETIDSLTKELEFLRGEFKTIKEQHGQTNKELKAMREQQSQTNALLENLMHFLKPSGKSSSSESESHFSGKGLSFTKEFKRQD